MITYRIHDMAIASPFRIPAHPSTDAPEIVYDSATVGPPSRPTSDDDAIYADPGTPPLGVARTADGFVISFAGVSFCLSRSARLRAPSS